MEMQKTITSLLILVLLLFGVVSALALEAPLLEADDCQMCHADVIAVVQEFGGKHRDAVTCIECHREHPPRGANAIPACSLCHDPAENEHFKAGGCLGCHNPHRPKQIDFSHAARVAPACSGCHPKQGGELLAYPSNHT